MDENFWNDLEIAEGTTEKPNTSTSETEYDHVPEIVAVCLRIINIIVGCFIIYILNKFKQLRVQFYTGYILHCNAIMVFNLILLLVSHLFCYMYQESFIVHCADFVLGIVVLPGEFALWIFMTIDWLLSVCNANKSENFRRWYYQTIILVYLYSISAAVIFPAMCQFDITVFNALDAGKFALFFRFLTIVIATIVYLWKIKRRSVLTANASILSMSAISFSSWLVLAFTITTDSFYIYWIGVCIATCNPILTLILCYYFDINFRTHFIEIIKSKCSQRIESDNSADAIVTMIYSNQINQVQDDM